MNKFWNSIIEIIVMITVLTIWIIWAYTVLNSWSKLSISAENRIQAVNIAREWIEALQNIRDTNWIKFSSDYTNCWNTYNYNSSCIWDNTYTNIISNWSYKLLRNWSLWYLTWTTAVSSSTAFSSYYPDQMISYDANWLISQSGSYGRICNKFEGSNCNSIFAREIKISYPSSTEMKVQSYVRWIENWFPSPREIRLEMILTNWKVDL